MQRISRKVQSLILALVLCCGIAFTGSVSRGSSPAEAAADYYAKITAAGGEELLGQVHDLITTTHTKYTSYTDCKNPSYYRRTDPGPNGELAEFYAQTELSSTWQSGANGTWNREHVWCQSHSNGLWGESGGGADLLHIRPTESRVNSARGNNKYAVITGAKNTVIYRNAANQNMGPAGYTGGGLFEPLDPVKGDVARIVLYVYTHYNTYSNVHGSTNGAGRSSYFGTLKLTDIVSASTETAAAEMLLDWNELDPPDDLERSRNAAAQEIQGNRNPFVDHPEYAEAIWGDGTVTVDPTGLSLSPSSLTLDVGQSETLTVIPTPAGANRSVTWSTSDAGVVTVTGGVVTAMNAGTATVTATSTVKPSLTATAQITVTQPQDSEGIITITAASFDLSPGYGFQTWSEGGASGIAFIYGSNANSMQFNKNKPSYYLAATAPLPGPIRSVTVKSSSLEGEDKGDREWKLLTSSEPYGEVEGKPENGNDCGTKTVTKEGTTWQVEGDDVFFALTYELEDEKGAAFLESIVIEYGSDSGSGGGGGTQEDVDQAKLEAFHTAVEGIVTEGSLPARAASLTRAIAAYGTLSEKERALAEEDHARLAAALETYNSLVRSYNGIAGAAESSALGGMGKLLDGGNA